MALRDARSYLEIESRPDKPAKRLVIALLDKPSRVAAYQLLEVDSATGARVPLAISFPSYFEAYAIRQAMNLDAA
jgi:hypothetical protein